MVQTTSLQVKLCTHLDCAALGLCRICFMYFGITKLATGKRFCPSNLTNIFN